MARSRNIKPSIMDNEELAELDPMTRLLFIYLWMLADREGKLEDRPKRIAAQALAYDRTADIDAMLDNLQQSGFIDRYSVGSLACIQIKSFAKHQNPHVREAASTLPEPSQGIAKAVTKHDLGSDEALPRSPDSGFLIPDSLYSDSGYQEAAPAKPSHPPRKPAAKPAIAKPDSVDQQTWDDWLTLRKAKKAPVTLTTVEGAANEATKAGMSLEAFLKVWCRRGSQGLEAAWLKDSERATANSAPAETTYQRSMRERYEEATGKGPRRTIDITPTCLEILQ
jgi:hypothetical protein